MDRSVAIRNQLSSKAPFLLCILWTVATLAGAQMSPTEKKSLFNRSDAGDAPAIETVRKMASDGDIASQTHLADSNRLDPDSYHAPTTSRFGIANSAGIGGSAGAGRPIRAA